MEVAEEAEEAILRRAVVAVVVEAEEGVVGAFWASGGAAEAPGVASLAEGSAMINGWLAGAGTGAGGQASRRVGRRGPAQNLNQQLPITSKR